jgi:Domain of unknown function (DUF6597)
VATSSCRVKSECVWHGRTISNDAMAMHYRHRVPRPPLDAFISSIWLFRDEPRPRALERVLPTAAAQLIVNLKEDRTRVYGQMCLYGGDDPGRGAVPLSDHRYV